MGYGGQKLIHWKHVEASGVDQIFIHNFVIIVMDDFLIDPCVRATSSSYPLWTEMVDRITVRH